MIHLGDITKIKGNEAPIVDCIIGGSPCQDLSLAGKRAGLAGSRSGLYMEQIRLIKEMRDNDRMHGRTGVDIRPRYMVWENVPGAFSTNGGQDFAAVLEEAIRVAEPEAPNVSVPEKGWPTAGCFVGECWSVAWRVLDAQFWGTSDKPLPQRRRRIALVADFGGLSAPEILFIRKSVSGDLEPGKPKRKEAPRDAGNSAGGAIGCDIYNLAISEDKAVSLTTASSATGTGPTVAVPYTLKIRGGCEGGGKGALIQEDKSATLSTLQDQTLFQPVISVDQSGGKSGANHYEEMSPTLTCTHGGEPAIAYGIQGSMIGRADHNGPQGDGVNEDVSFTLNTTDRHAVVYGISPYHSNCMKSDNPHSGYYEADTSRSLDAMNCGYPGCNQGGMAVVQPILDDKGGSHISVRDDGKCPTLRAETHGNLPCVLESYSVENHPADSRVDIDPTGKVQTLTSRMGTGGGNVPMVLEATGFEMQAFGKYKDSGTASALKARDYKDATDLVVAGVDCRNATEYPEMNATLQSDAAHNLNSNNVVRVKHIVRRLTPLECERLQGFPDGWTDIGEWVDSKGKKHKEADSPRYKALGNSIAIPPWKWVLKRLCACYERDATMASLFDGIGGFPYIWEQLNGKGSCLWASEIEEFPMAVTKLRFGGGENG